jgi:hypothetical protein
MDRNLQAEHTMKRIRHSTIVFCHVSTSKTYLLRSCDLALVGTYPEVADSVIQSLAAYNMKVSLSSSAALIASYS